MSPRPRVHESPWKQSPRVFPAALWALSLGLLMGSGPGCSRDATSTDEPGSSNLTNETSPAGSPAPAAQTDGAASNESGFVEPPRNVRVLSLARGDLSEFLVLSGPLRPARGADISAEESGVVAEVIRDKGAYVKRGEPILALDRRILEAEQTIAEAVEQLNRFNDERTEALFEDNSVSGQERLVVHTQSAQAQAQADIARLRYERAAFPAPFSGVVSERFVEVGELVAPGTRVARIIDPYRLELVGSITERDVASVNQGAPVEVSLEGVPGTVSGVVAWVGFEADPLNGKFPVEITIDNRDLDLRPGLLGRARIEKQAHVEILSIPRDAVIPTGDGPTVFVAEGDRARRRTVSLGVDQGTLVEVRSGLEPGDELIVRGHRDLADGTPVTIQERATRRDGSIESDPIGVGDTMQSAPSGREVGVSGAGR